MDFDPHGAKWQCCCCSLPSGLQVLATAEVVISTAIAAVTTLHMSRQKEAPSWFEICLILMMIIMATSSALLILGIHKHRPKLMYPTLAARGLLIIFIQVFGVSTVVSPHSETFDRDGSRIAPTDATGNTPNVALRLILLVFAMLFLTVLLFYCIYLVVRGIHFQFCFARMKERRASILHAGMIDPDFGSRRTSNT